MRTVELELPEKLVEYIWGRKAMIESALGKKILFKDHASDFVSALIENRMRGKA